MTMLRFLFHQQHFNELAIIRNSRQLDSIPSNMSKGSFIYEATQFSGLDGSMFNLYCDDDGQRVTGAAKNTAFNTNIVAFRLLANVSGAAREIHNK